MERSHGRELEVMSGAPVKKLPASASVSSPSVPVADRGGEEVDVGFSDFWAGSGNKLRDPRLRRSAGNDRKHEQGVARFFRRLSSQIYRTETAARYQKRFGKNRQ